MRHLNEFNKLVLQKFSSRQAYTFVKGHYVPIILNNVSYEDSYDGDFQSRRVIIYTLTFTAKNYLYGPVTSSKVIKTVQVDQYADMPVNTPKREQRYTVTPDPIDADGDDNFGFNETTSFFQDAKEYDPESGTDKNV